MRRKIELADGIARKEICKIHKKTMREKLHRQ